ncbi:MAG: ABC transporter substrate-binding protein [Acidimicrobiia bacterium]|nr:ABC transporter substrate-binding protein [Acidimicrobiia bacterium]
MRRFLTVLVLVTLVAAGCGDDSDDSDDGAPAPSTTEGAGATTTTGGNQASGDPVVVGVINMENAPTGSFPEIREGMQAAADYLNAELGGVTGHPIQLESCTTNGTPEATTQCANEMVEKGVTVVAAGEDIQMGSAYPILEEAGISVVGLAPLTPADFSAPNGFYFSGGTVASMLALVAFVDEYLQAGKVAVMFQDEAAGQAALPLVTGPLDKLGIEHVEIGEAPDAADFTPAVTAAQQADPDVLLLLFAPQGCAGIMKAHRSLGLDIPMATTGACYTDEVIESAGEGAEGTYFTLGPSLEDPEDDEDVALYREKVEQYASGVDYRGLTGLGFSTIMTLYYVLDGIGFDALSPASVMDALKTTQGGRLFMGEPAGWTCGQLAIMPSLCNTAVRIYQYQEGGLVDATDGAFVDGRELLG